MLKRFLNRQTPLIGPILSRAFGPRVLAKRMTRYLAPQNVDGFERIRIGNPEGDGGYVMMNDFSSVVAALSIGIGGDVSWDLDIAAMDIDVYQYDHTVNAPPIAHPRFHFRKVGVGPASSRDPLFLGLSCMLKELPGVGDVILKMDVEGAEWEALASVEPRVLRRFSQIVIEMHYPLAGTTLARLRRLWLLRKLLKTHTVVHIHGNNYGVIETHEGLMFPSVFEVTYVRTKGRRIVPFKGTILSGLDRPNNPQDSDYNLESIFGGA